MASFTLSVDDGCASDVKVAALANKYGIETVFYLPVEWRSLAYEKGYEPLTYAQASKIAEDFEIGSHGLTHRYLTRVSYVDALHEILESKTMLQDLFNISVTKFCHPRGYGNEEINKFILKHYESYRLTKGTDSKGYKLVHVHPDSGANDNKPWRDCITDKTHLWMHSFDLDNFSLWGELESVLRDD